MLMTNLTPNSLFHSVRELQVELLNKNYSKPIMYKNFAELYIFVSSSDGSRF